MATPQTLEPIEIRQGDTHVVELEVRDPDSGDLYNFTNHSAALDVRLTKSDDAAISLSTTLATIHLSLGSVTYALNAATLSVATYGSDFRLTKPTGAKETLFEQQIKIVKPWTP